MLHNPSGHFADTAWFLIVGWSEWLKRGLVVPLCLWAFLKLLQCLIKGVGVGWSRRIIALLPEPQHMIGNSHTALYGKARIARDEYLSLLGEQELRSTWTQLPFFDDREYILFSTANVDCQVFWFHISGML